MQDVNEGKKLFLKYLQNPSYESLQAYKEWLNKGHGEKNGKTKKIF